MKKEELEELKLKLSMLSDEEKKQRDLYLKGLSSGEIQGPLTGYPSIDKPWLRYHDDEAIAIDFNDMSAYQLMYENNKENRNEVMCEYFGRKITFGQAFKEIDVVAKALIEIGVQKNDVVMVSMPNCPEIIYLFYAINKIGATINSVDPRYSSDNLVESVKEAKAKYFFATSLMVNNLENLPDDVSIISISPYNSLPAGIREFMMIKNLNKGKIDRKTISWNKFMSYGKKSKINNVPNEISGSIICHTGGSTGIPKGVILSNYNFNGLVYQLLNNRIGLNRGYTFLNILPPFVAMGLDDGLHLAACAGINQYLIPSVNPEEFADLVLKYKPNIILCGPIHCNMMMNSEKLLNEDLSFLKIIMFGGGEYPIRNQEQFNDFLHSHGAYINLYNGYGATETASGSSCQNSSCYKIGSAGAPYIGCVDAIFDPDTLEEIRGYNKIGELYVSGPTVMQGYFGNSSSETDEVIYTDKCGNRWYKSGDLAHFDEDGMLFIDGRIKRIIIRRAFKIYPQYIEQLILKHVAVSECAVVGIPDPDEFSIPVANIVLKDEYLNNIKIQEDVIKFADEVIANEVSAAAVMAGYNFLDELPKTPIGKLDFKKLESIGIIDNKIKRLQKKYDMT